MSFTPRLLISILCLWHLSCSRPGINDEASSNSPPPSSDNAQREDSRSTHVSLGLFETPRFTTKTCRGAMSVPTAGLTRMPTINGTGNGWPENTYTINDPNGDVQGSDIEMVKLGLFDGDLFLAAKSQHPADDELYIELGGIGLDKNQRFQEQTIHYLRATRDGLSWWRNDKWEDLPEQTLFQQFRQSMIEIRLSRLLVGEVLRFPGWWIKVGVKSPGSLTPDEVGMTYFPGDAAATEQKFSFNSCMHEYSENNSGRINQIRDLNVSAEAAEESFNLARLALTRLTEIMDGKKLPFADVTFIATTAGRFTEPHFLNTNDVWKNHYAIRLDAEAILRQTAIPWSKETVYQDILVKLLDGYLASKAPQMRTDLRRSFGLAMIQAHITSDLGRYYWLSQYWIKTDPFLTAKPDSTDSVVFEKLKLQAFAQILARDWSMTDLLTAWDLAATAQSDAEFAEKWIHSLDEARAGKLRLMLTGWILQGDYDQAFHPSTLQDQDGDGLPFFIEAKIGSSFEEADTDRDGWSDMAEWLKNTSPVNSADHPDEIVSDGNMGDWRDLIPSRIKADEDSATEECQGFGDIRYYAALAHRNRIVIAAELKDGSEAPGPLTWQIMLDLPQSRKKFLVASVSGSRTYTVGAGEESQPIKTYFHPSLSGKKTLEVVIEGGDLGIREDLTQPQSVNLRITTLMQLNSQHFCDDTPWFSPLVNGTGL